MRTKLEFVTVTIVDTNGEAHEAQLCIEDGLKGQDRIDAITEMSTLYADDCGFAYDCWYE